MGVRISTITWRCATPPPLTSSAQIACPLPRYNPLYRGSNPASYVSTKLQPDLRELVSRYKPDDILVDGEWEQVPAEHPLSTRCVPAE